MFQKILLSSIIEDLKKAYNNPELTTIVENYLAEIYDDEQIYSSGLKIYTTIDLDYQKVARDNFQMLIHILKTKKINGAIGHFRSIHRWNSIYSWW